MMFQTKIIPAILTTCNWLMHVLEDGIEKGVGGVGLDQDQQHVSREDHGRIDCPGVDWNTKDLGLNNSKEAEPCIIYIKCSH